MKYFIAFVLFYGIHQIRTEDDLLPDYIHPCTFTEPDFEKCVIKQIEGSLPHFTKGIPNLGVPSIDPVKLDDIIIATNGLNLTFTDAQMHGLRNSKLTQLKLDLGKQEEFITLGVIANLSLISKYNADGKILILPIKGQGDAFIECYGIEVEFTCKLNHVKGHKGIHLKLSSPSYKYDIQSTTFDLKNLFNGNKQLAETTLKFANENWKELMNELAPDAVKQIVKTIIKAINKFFNKVTISTIIKGYNPES